MKLSRRRWVIGVLVVVVLMGVGWLFFGHNSEPRYQGKPVSYWFKEYYSPFGYAEPDSDNHQDAVNALRAMGSNALPYLVQVAFSTNEDTPSRTNFYNLLGKLPDSWHLPQLVTQDEIRYCATEAVQEIGPSAQEILPLIRTQLDQKNTVQHRTALAMLTCVTNGIELVIPYFVRSVHDSDSLARNLAISGLGDFGPNASLAVPGLMDVFENAPPGDRIRWKVVFVLGLIGSNAAPAAPKLKEAFERETDWIARGRLASCLCEIDSNQAYALNYLIDILTNAVKPGQISFGATRLAEIGPGARAAIPALLDVLKTTNCDDVVSGDVVRALTSLGASNDQVLPVLKLKLDTGSDKLREEVLNQIRILDPSEHEAVLALTELVLRHSKNERWAIIELGRTGTKAKVAVPVLKQEMEGTNTELSATAKYALGKIDPKAVEK